MEDKLELKEILALVDTYAKNVWSELTAEQAKNLKKDFFVLNRFVSSVKSNDNAIVGHYVTTTNEYYNKHWFTLQRHPELLWKLLCMCSYDPTKIQYHEWVGFKKGTSSKVEKFLESIYPDLRTDEITLLAKVTSADEIKQLAYDHGYEQKQIKALFK